MQTIYLDISNKGVIPCIQAKQSEVGRKFLAVITDNGMPYNIPNDSLLSVWYEGDTDAGNYSSIEENSAFSIDGNKVTVELVAQMLLKPGMGELCLSITHGDGGETNTWNIPYCVEYKPGAGSSVPTEYYTALTEAGALAAEQAGIAREAANDALIAAGRLNDVMNILLPIGYIFQWNPVDGSDVDLSTPEKVHSYFGIGVWEQVKDRFLLAAGDNYEASETGGESSHAITVEEMPRHKHDKIIIDQIGTVFRGASNGSELGMVGNLATIHYNTGVVGEVAGNYDFTTNDAGGNTPMDTMPPYISVYTWQRIA